MNVVFPTSLQQACDELAGAVAGGRVLRPMAGATDLLVHWPANQAAHEGEFLDLSGVAELRPMAWSEAALALGGLTTYWDVVGEARVAAEFPLLVQAARQVGAVQIQSRGTWAGNIANGSPAADGVPVLMAYDASVVLQSIHGTRTVLLSEFYTGYRKSIARPEELIVAISIPRRAYDFGVFHKVGPRRAQAITKVGLAITRAAEPRHGKDRWRVVANSVAPTVVRCRAIERMLNEGAAVKSPDDFLTAAAMDIAPIDDIRSTAEYRRTVLCRLLYHSVSSELTAH